MSTPLVRPVKPPPPFGKSIAARTTTVAPANMSVISARNRPDRRRAGNPTRIPIAQVIAPPIRSSKETERRPVAESQADPQPSDSSAI